MCRLESRHLKSQKEFPELCETKVRVIEYILYIIAKDRGLGTIEIDTIE